LSTNPTEESRKLWNAIAPGWERHRAQAFEQQRGVSERLIKAMDAREGDTILELTAGPGETGLLLAEQTPGARVIISDFAPRMVQAASNAAKARKLTNVEVRQIDAQSIDLPDQSVQGVMSRYGLMLVPDYKAAFGEIRRVLAPGRSLAYGVWGPLPANPWMMLFGAVFMQRGHWAPPEGGAVFPLTTEDENREVTRMAGFDNVEIEVMEGPMRFKSVDHYWEVNSNLAGPLAVIAQNLPQDEIDAMRSLIDEYSSAFKTDSGVSFPSQSIVVRAS
jgi:SAM-dependent methyltransferase